LTVVAMLVASGCAGTSGDRPTSAASSPPLSAGAPLQDKEGRQVGVATLVETPDGVRISVSVNRLPPGPKGLHIHAVGLCQPPEFTSAGAHFNPGEKKHGRLNPEGAHAGDLPNLVVAANGNGRVDFTSKLVTLRAGAPNSLLGEKGTAVVVHAAADDERTDPTGNSGARIACGVIAR